MQPLSALRKDTTSELVGLISTPHYPFNAAEHKAESCNC